MAKRFNPYVLIPIVLNLLVLVAVPSLFESNEFGRALFVFIVAILWPWILYFVIGRILHDLVRRVSEERGASENHDLV